ncbi:MAG: DEAD/DEAH box helicase [Candidatus Pacebacteria bacterium]|nr:DEAD/DEAH box helicase [Candidatus Paceibacterota bacterium]
MQRRSFSKNNYKKSSSRFGSKGGFKKGGSFGRGFSGKQKRFFSGKLDIAGFIQKSQAEIKNHPVKEEVYKPSSSFSDFKIENSLKNNILKKGYKDPTPIQDQAIPLLLQGKDMVGIANTGQGKTAAFLIPAINNILLNRENKTIIIVPTRELALQIEKDFKDLSAGLRVFAVTCIGGAGIRNQFYGLRRGYDFIIGTPGRIKDLVQRKALDMSKIKTVVLDEADRMLDMGFVEDINFLLSKTPASRQTLFFSATFPSAIDKLAGRFTKNPIKISVKTRETPLSISQEVVRTGGNNGKKMDKLCELLAGEDFSKVLIFGKTKWGVENLSEDLAGRGFKSESIHGGKTQSKRQKALNFFKANQIKVLVATDVAARGLDIDNVTHVINYDLPATYDDYVHRIGRTGRGQNKGKAITFI